MGTFTFTQLVHVPVIRHCMNPTRAFLSLSLSLHTHTHTHTHATHTHTPSHPPSSPIETGYQSYLLNLMHALSTHSHPVTSPLNIETGFSGITRTSISQRPPPPPHPTPAPLRPPVCDRYKPACAPIACTSTIPLWVCALLEPTHETLQGNCANKGRTQLIALIYCLMGNISSGITQF